MTDPRCTSCRALPVRVRLIAPVKKATPFVQLGTSQAGAIYRCAWCGNQMSKEEACREN